MNLVLGEDKILHFDIAYFTGGSQILPRTPTATGSSPISLSFHPKRTTIHVTQTPDVHQLQASLRFHLPLNYNVTWHRNLREVHFRAPRIPVRAGSLGFDLYGFWSMDAGKLCMVGSGSSYANLGVVSSLNVVLKLNYPLNFSNISSLIRGVFESLDEKGSLHYFEPISILAIPHFGEYKYTLMEKGNESACFSGNDDGSGRENENLHVELLDPSTCLTHLYRYARSFELEYSRDCGNDIGGKCNPLGADFGFVPKFMTIQGIRCEHGHAIRVLIGFSNSGYYGSGPFAYQRVFNPNTMLIAEGAWDEKKDRLCVVACRVLNFKDSIANASVGDCLIRLSLRFPRTLTIRHRSTVVGQIWSNKNVNAEGYFHRIGFHGSWNRVRGLQGLKYEYTVLDKVSKSCAKKVAEGKGKTYPDGYSLDMRFDMSVRNGNGQIGWGQSSPLFVGDQLYEPYQTNNHHNGLLNISYKMSFAIDSDFKLGNKLLSNETVEISAEGSYDNETGVLCMIGCWHLASHSEKLMKNDSVDCEILVNLQFSSTNAKGGNNIKGTIESMREKSDPLYFSRLEISSNSIYTSQAAQSIWRMDVEITMVLISNTLACVFVGLQLYHVKRHPDLLPFLSLVMLVVLTLGHMIPLLLNFDALFTSNHNRQNIFFRSGGWLEINEVIVRVVTMVAFLLQFRLLQLTWSGRQSDGKHKSLRLAEKRVVYLSLPLYVGGGLIAWYVHQWKNAYKGSSYLRPPNMGYQQQDTWGDLKSYAGLVPDGFLLPQIMFNLFLNSRENTLASSFYIGTTIVRLLPHAYDLYRAHSSAWNLDLSYIYANHRQDFYSTAWDIIIPFVGLLFATLIYMQQKFGGRCMFPKRFRGTSEYEKVPIVSREELQGETVH